MIFYIIAAIIALLAVLSFIRINAVFSAAYSDGRTDAEFYVKYLFIKIPLFKPPAKEEEEQNEKEKKDSDSKADGKGAKSSPSSGLKRLYSLLTGLEKDISRILGFLANHLIVIRDFGIEGRIGTGDPMYTGLAVGTAYSFLYSLTGFMDNSLRLKSFFIDISPDWNNNALSGGIYMKISTNIFNILIIGTMLLKAYLKARRILKRL